MTPQEHLQHIRDIAKKDGRYAPEAFLFVSEAIGLTAAWLKDGTLSENDTGAGRGGEGEFHVSGRELLAGVRRLAGERWGALAGRVLFSWGVYRTEDIGEIVFCMVEDEKLQWRRRACDTRDDFAGGYDIETAFRDL